MDVSSGIDLIDSVVAAATSQDVTTSYTLSMDRFEREANAKRGNRA